MKNTLAFLSSCFPTWPKKSGQKFKYLKNEKSILDIINKISFLRLLLKQIKPILLDGDSRAFRKLRVLIYLSKVNNKKNRKKFSIFKDHVFIILDFKQVNFSENWHLVFLIYCRMKHLGYCKWRIKFPGFV